MDELLVGRIASRDHLPRWYGFHSYCRCYSILLLEQVTILFWWIWKKGFQLLIPKRKSSNRGLSHGLCLYSSYPQADYNLYCDLFIEFLTNTLSQRKSHCRFLIYWNRLLLPFSWLTCHQGRIFRYYIFLFFMIGRSMASLRAAKNLQLRNFALFMFFLIAKILLYTLYLR